MTHTFEFDKNGDVAPGNIRIAINNGMLTQTLMTQIVNSINGVAGFAVNAESLPNSNRITLRGESGSTGAVSTSLSVPISGAPGGSLGDVVIPIEETSDSRRVRYGPGEHIRRDQRHHGRLGRAARQLQRCGHR